MGAVRRFKGYSYRLETCFYLLHRRAHPTIDASIYRIYWANQCFASAERELYIRSTLLIHVDEFELRWHELANLRSQLKSQR